jgi:hypothetical protein
VETVLLLLAVLGSTGLLLLTVAVLLSVVPALALAFTTTVRVTLWPLFSVGRLQLTVLPLPLGVVSVPTLSLRVALTNEVPAGSGLVSIHDDRALAQIGIGNDIAVGANGERVAGIDNDLAVLFTIDCSLFGVRRGPAAPAEQ